MKLSPVLYLGILMYTISGTANLAAQKKQYEPVYELPDSTQLVAVYIGAETCGPCHFPETKQAVEDMKVALAGIAKQKGWSFKAVGVSLDWDPQIGYKFLQENGKFDEMIIGRNWANLGAETYIWQADEVYPAIPQVIVYQQEVKRGQNGITFSKRSEFRRFMSNDIQKWLRDGSPPEFLESH